MIRLFCVGLLGMMTMTGPALEPLERIGRLAAPAIREASGLVASRRHPGIFWVHNDSQNPPELFAVRRDGALVRSYSVAIPNIDWEDITTDDSGHLYIADTGNNHLVLPIRAIYQVDEPDPNRATDPKQPLRVLNAYRYGFAPQARFDAEGLVVAGDSALVVSKRRDGRPAEVYRLPLRTGAPLFRPALPERVATLAGCVEPVTGATLTRDGRTLAVVTDRSVRVYESRNLADWTLIGSTAFAAPDVEAITWDGADLILASEDRSLYRVPERRWRSSREPKR